MVVKSKFKLLKRKIFVKKSAHTGLVKIRARGLEALSPRPKEFNIKNPPIDLKQKSPTTGEA
jgi:hypothetical protein